MSISRFNKKKIDSPIKAVYSSHALDPMQVIEGTEMPFYVGATAPEHIALLIQRVYHKSIVRMHRSLTLAMVASLNKYSQSGKFEYDEEKAIDLEGEITRCGLIMQHSLPPEEYEILAPESIRVVLIDLLFMTRREIMNTFAQTFNIMGDDMAKSHAENAETMAKCIMTFANLMPVDTRMN